MKCELCSQLWRYIRNTGALPEYLLSTVLIDIHAGYILSNQHLAAFASLASNIWKVGRTKLGIWITVFFHKVCSCPGK